jgi:hypothetical protein
VVPRSTVFLVPAEERIALLEEKMPRTCKRSFSVFGFLRERFLRVRSG